MIEAATRYVYLISLDRYHKIGSSRDVEKRMRQLDVGPYEPRVVHQFPSANALRVEKALHRRFRPQRVRGEWFDLSPEDIALLCSVQSCDSVDSLPPSLAPPPGLRNRTGVGLHVYIDPALAAVIQNHLDTADPPISKRELVECALHQFLRARRLLEGLELKFAASAVPAVPAGRGRAQKKGG